LSYCYSEAASAPIAKQNIAHMMNHNNGMDIGLANRGILPYNGDKYFLLKGKVMVNHTQIEEDLRSLLDHSEIKTYEP
ncbi:hypothetical protein R0K17_31960, partial [Planococcus sp. SIMBA_143]